MDRNIKNLELLEIGELAYQWLSALKQKVNREFIISEITAHTEYPALVSVMDLLDEGNLQYHTRRAAINNISEFNFPVIVQLSLPDGRNGLFQIDDAAALNTLQQYWNGIILYASEGSQWHHPANEELMRTNTRRLYSFLAFAVALLTVTISVCFFTAEFTQIVFLLSSAAGVLISLLILSKELDIITGFVQKICGIKSGRNSCANVLDGRYARTKNNFSVAECAAIYFSGQWLVWVSAMWVEAAAASIQTVITIALGGIFIAGWSIYLQKIVVKSWCAWCLALAAILTIQFITACLQTPAVTGPSVLYFAVVLLLLLVIVHPVKTLLKQLRKLDLAKRELYRWKKDVYLFIQQLENGERVDCSAFDEELELANPNGYVQLTLACDLYCKPCAAIYEQIDQLVTVHGTDISVRIRFATNALSDSFTAAANLIINTSLESKVTRRSIHDWYRLMNIKKFREKWPSKNDRSNFELLKKHEQWAEAADIEYTPVLFVNGWKLPKRYQVEDLTFLLPDLCIQLADSRQ